MDDFAPHFANSNLEYGESLTIKGTIGSDGIQINVCTLDYCNSSVRLVWSLGMMVSIICLVLKA